MRLHFFMTNVNSIRAKTCFTLIELLVVISIIAILSALLMPALQKTLALTYDVSCKNNMHQISMSVNYYENDYNSWLPMYYNNAETGRNAFWYGYRQIGQYVGQDQSGNLLASTFHCPSRERPGTIWQSTYSMSAMQGNGFGGSTSYLQRHKRKEITGTGQYTVMMFAEGAVKTSSPIEYQSNFYDFGSGAGEVRIGAPHISDNFNAVFFDGHISNILWYALSPENFHQY